MAEDPNSEPFSPPTKTYDVFLSFEGETRSTFTSHLYGALCQKGILHTFKDDDALERGKDIAPELMNAIQDSEYAVVVLSENYATSSWCLKELAQIVELMGDSGRIWTIFYRVDPSHVRHVKSKDDKEQQESRFWNALAEHAKNPDHSEYVESWRDALCKVGKQRGDHVVKHETDEAKFIKDFVGELLLKLGAWTKTLVGLFGMSTRLTKLDSCVRQCSDKICVIGVHGIGGIGKSTLATAYCMRMAHNFDRGYCYLRNIRETCEKRENGLVHLQNTLLQKFIDRFDKIRDVANGIAMIRRRLCNKKVLIVLDDVNEFEQLKALGVEDKLFGSGSVIIMTTRNENLLKESYCTKYAIEQLDNVEACHLFSTKAFGIVEPPEEYKELSRQVVKCCENLPLALTILGSHLHQKRSEGEWKGALERLQQCPKKEIVEKLKISYDDLDEKDKCFFLDIACFFKGRDINDVKPILDACGFSSEYGIKNLTDRALLELQHDRILKMCDLIQKMGHEIARQGPDKSGRPSRLWEVTQFKNILGKKREAENVEAIVVTFQNENGTSCFRGLSNMERLRLLMVLGAFHFQAGRGDLTIPELDYLCSDLYLLDWNGFPFKQFPSGFEPYELVELKLIGSNLERLWNSSEELPNLKVINLTDSRNFITFGDFSVFPNLEILILEGCTQMLEIDPSIEVLKRLIILNLKFCTSLRELPPSIKGLNCLKQFNLNGCEKLRKLPEDIGDLYSLEMLDVRGTSIKHLPSSISRIKNLQILMNEEDRVNLGKTPKLSKIQYEVFLSFRKGSINVFPSNLYKALRHKRIRTSFNEYLPRSYEVSPAFLKPIEESYCSVIVLSEDYGSSSWCLTELAKIVECMQKRNHIVIPIFYCVDPLCLRKFGRYIDALEYYEINHSNKLASWRDALKEIENLATGQQWTFEAGDIEQHFIQVFVEYLEGKLNDRSRFYSENPSEVDSLLKNDEINPTIGKASTSSDSYSSKMSNPRDGKLPDVSFHGKDGEETTAFTSLRRHFQEPSGATKRFDIVVRGSEIPPWFTNRSSGGSINVKVNPNWCNSNWMGLALVVCFRAIPSNVLYCDMKLDSTLWKVKRRCYDYATVGNSNQIWLFYYPRHKWPKEELLNSYFNLDFSFRPMVPFHDDYGPCGVRLVYKEDIEELNKFHKQRTPPFSPKRCRDYQDDTHFKHRLGFRRRSI